MGAAPVEPVADNRRSDLHDTLAQIAHAEARLRSEDSGVPSETAQAILEFVEARREAVSAPKTMTYFANPQAAPKRLGRDLQESNRETPAKFLRPTAKRRSGPRLRLAPSSTRSGSGGSIAMGRSSPAGSRYHSPPEGRAGRTTTMC